MAAHAKLYYLPKSFLVRLLNELTNDELNELARDVAKNDLVDISLFLRGGFNLASISEIAETWQCPIDLKSMKIQSRLLLNMTWDKNIRI